MCRFKYCPWIMFVVCILDLVKVLIMMCIWILRRWQEKERQMPQKQVLYTLGDAIATFTQEPDPTTKDMGRATKDDFISRRTWKSHLVKMAPEPDTRPRAFYKDSRRWWTAASSRRWIVLISLCV